jgi:Ca-activated chloride channel family protein
VRVIAALASVLPLAACYGSPPPAAHGRGTAGAQFTLRVLASSELTDMRPILAQAARATGVTVALTPVTTLAGTRTVTSGQAAGRYDATWFATDRYLAMTPGGLARLDGSNPIMSSPVILGVRASAAHRLGWGRKPVTWAGIAAAAAAGRFSFGMSDPASSNSALSALVGVATAIAGNGAALQAAEVTQASPRLREFFGGQSLKASSPAALVSDYLHAQDGDAQGSPIDGLIDYESTLASLNASGKLREPLTLIYPSDGVVTADYTLSLLASAPLAAKNAYDRLVSYLLTPAIQRQLMQQTRRRAAIPQVRPDPGLARHLMFELPFPATPDVIGDLISSYYGTLRRPARTVYAIDISQSMAGAPLAELKTALAQLTGATTSAAAFQPREQVTFQPFSTAPYPPMTFDVPARNPQPVRSLISDFIASQAAGGSTAIYDALVAAYQVITRQAATDPNRITTIVLLTNGHNTTGRDLAAFTRFYHSLPPAIASVPVFPILLGNADAIQMQQLATLTSGQTFNARRLPLNTILALIRENQ